MTTRRRPSLRRLTPTETSRLKLLLAGTLVSVVPLVLLGLLTGIAVDAGIDADHPILWFIRACTAVLAGLVGLNIVLHKDNDPDGSDDPES